MTSAYDLVHGEEQGGERIMIVGYPGAGKTGALACLANAGFKLRIEDFDGNLKPLLLHCTEEGLKNIDALQLEDKLRGGTKFVETVGLPTAFADGLKALDHWKYKNKAGEETDLGRSRDWGPDTIVVLDSITQMGKASFRRALAFANRTPLNTRDSDWGFAMSEQEAFIEKMTRSDNRFHVIVLAHLKIVGPRDIRQGDDDLTKELKEKVADLVPTRYYPSALGKALPPEIGGHFPTLLEVKSKFTGAKHSRVINAVPRPELDLKFPGKELPANLDISDGMLKVMEALTGGVAKCLEAGASFVSTQEEES